MNPIDTVWAIATKLVDSSELVDINDRVVSEVANSVAAWKKEVYANRASRCSVWNYPKCIDPDDPKAVRKLFLYELIASSVNYCYWYGRHDIRPEGANSVKMYNLLDESFGRLNEMLTKAQFHPQGEVEIIINTFIEGLSRARFPLIDRRVAHLTEILNRSDLLSIIEISVQREDYRLEEWLDYIITSFPGYSRDMFLKRAFLFIMQMYRRCGIFEKEIGKILIPADYQVPKILRWLGCIEYDDALARVVDEGFTIAENSKAECEIRAATIVACERIGDRAGCTCEEVDTYLWGKRNETKAAFHLTITTNY